MGLKIQFVIYPLFKILNTIQSQVLTHVTDQKINFFQNIRIKNPLHKLSEKACMCFKIRRVKTHDFTVNKNKFSVTLPYATKQMPKKTLFRLCSGQLAFNIFLNNFKHLGALCVEPKLVLDYQPSTLVCSIQLLGVKFLAQRGFNQSNMIFTPAKRQLQHSVAREEAH